MVIALPQPGEQFARDAGLLRPSPHYADRADQRPRRQSVTQVQGVAGGGENQRGPRALAWAAFPLLTVWLPGPRYRSVVRLPAPAGSLNEDFPLIPGNKKWRAEVFFLRKSLKMTLLCLLAMLFLRAPGRPDGERQNPGTQRPHQRLYPGFAETLCPGRQGRAKRHLVPAGHFPRIGDELRGRGGETRKELASVLHFPDDDQKLIKDLADLHRDLEATPWYKPAKVTVANAVWIDSTTPSSQGLCYLLGKGFSASLHSAKFAQQTKASDEINQWVSQNTHGKIAKTVDPDDSQSRSRPGYY